MGGQRNAYGDRKLGGGMERSVNIYLRKMWKLWKGGGSKDKYLDAKRKARKAVYTPKINAEKEKFTSVKDNKRKASFLSPNKYVQKIKM